MITTTHETEIDLHGLSLLVEFTTTELESGHWWEPQAELDDCDRWVSAILSAKDDGQDVVLSADQADELIERLTDMVC